MTSASDLHDRDLLNSARRVAKRAVQTGALRPIETTIHHVEQDGVRFVVRMLGSASGRVAAQQRLQQATFSSPANPNPFLPYDPALFVADLSPTHLCLLNKYPVVADHLLVVTRMFEAQETLLTSADFEALMCCMGELDGLAFYNSGQVAGASQRHKHLQFAPFPLDPFGVDAPIETALGYPDHSAEVVHSPDLPIPHAMCWLPRNAVADPAFMEAAYRALLTVIGVWNGEEAAPKAYNWLATHRWMLAVPRCAESIEGMSVNGLGFAGSLLVRHDAQLAWLHSFGPLSALAAVSGLDARGATE